MIMPYAYPVFCLVTTLAYAAIIACYLRGWQNLPNWEIPKGFVPKTTVSVLLPARNEAAHISACLQALLGCRYPKERMEIVVLDDHSDEDTADIVACIAADCMEGLVRLVRLADQPGSPVSGKKAALSLGVSLARGELIITTDADCLVPTNWLLLLVSLYETEHPGAIAGPVIAHHERTAFQRFQALDLAGMAGITGAGIGLGWHHLGNGANLCYTKTMFRAVGGYNDNTDRASGDDVFLLQKIAQQHSVLFLKNPAAAVRTEVCPDLQTFVQQRLRWGTKNTGMPDMGAKAVLAVVFLCCTTCVLNVLLLFFFPALLWVWLGQLAIKALADYALLREMCAFFFRRDLLRRFWPAFFGHTAYITGIGAVSLFAKRYRWKGRELR